MTRPLSIAIAGAGLIGKRHVEAIAATPLAKLHSIIDPSQAAQAYAASLDVECYESLTQLLAKPEAARPDGIIIATPNALHVQNGMECVEAGIPALIEKPLADDLDAARNLVAAGEETGVALLVGHHRRHNPLIRAAKTHIEYGALGTIAAVHGMFWVMKPDEYFDTAWRREPGGGPILINLIHDIDLLRHLLGEIGSVHAIQSSAQRGFVNPFFRWNLIHNPSYCIIYPQ